MLVGGARQVLVRNPRSWLGTAGSIVAVCAVLLGTVELAVRPVPVEALDPLARVLQLDYSNRAPGEFAPLSSRFIAQALGIVISDRSATLGAFGPRSAVGSSRPQRLVVEHPFNNDDFKNAYEIPSVPFGAKSNMAGATRQPGEPAQCAQAGGTVWYSYRPKKDVGLSVSTFGTKFSTTVGVFTGTSLEDLRNLGCHSDPASYSHLIFQGDPGTIYFIQVTAGLLGGGELTLLLDPLDTATIASISSTGERGDSYSREPSISADGRFVAFESFADNLVSNDVKVSQDVFVRDRITGKTTLVSLSSSGVPGNNASWSHGGTLSDDGRYVAFNSYATNLVSPRDANGFEEDAFVHDRLTGVTELVSVSSSGQQGNGTLLSYVTVLGGGFDTADAGVGTPRRGVSLSGDGRYVGFTSWATNLVSNDTNDCPGFPSRSKYRASRRPACQDVFVRDRVAGTTTRVSVSSSGEQGNDGSSDVRISADGRYVAFYSEASNLVPGDTNLIGDIFVHDRLTGRTTRASVSSSGEQQNDWGFYRSAISGDGRFVAFNSKASNLVPEDTNGASDVFVHDRFTGRTTRVSVSSFGQQAVGGLDPTLASMWSWVPWLSRDGRYVTFASYADNLVPGDTNETQDVFVHDRLTGRTVRVSYTPTGEETDSYSGPQSVISADGRFVAFQSWASNIAPGDTNDSIDVFVYEFPAFR